MTPGGPDRKTPQGPFRRFGLPGRFLLTGETTGDPRCICLPVVVRVPPGVSLRDTSVLRTRKGPFWWRPTRRLETGFFDLKTRQTGSVPEGGGGGGVVTGVL